MNSFLTQCPHCHTSFRITERQVEAAGGAVRCGACLGLFSAPSNRITVRQPLTPEQLEALRQPPEEIDDETWYSVPVALAAEDPDTPAARAHEPPPATATHREPPAGDDADEEDIEDDFPRYPAPSPAPPVFAERDYDIPLGDFNLDDESDDEPDDDADDHAIRTQAATTEFEDDDSDWLDEEYPEGLDSATDSDTESDADFIDEEEEEEEEEDYAGEDETPPHPAERTPDPTLEKQAYRKHLATLRDEDALEPLAPRHLDTLTPEPLLLGGGTRRSPATFAALCGLNLLLAALFVLQYIDANLDRLSRSPAFAPALPWVCRILECPLPPRASIASLRSQELLVRSHPRYPQALEVSIVFSNEADLPQPFPALELGFADIDNRVLANRLFRPEEYLQSELLALGEMPAGASVQVLLELADPGSAAVNYTLAFRAP